MKNRGKGSGKRIAGKSSGKRIRVRIRKNWQLYLFLLVPVGYIILFKYIPMGGLVMAFEDYKMRDGIFGSEWVGLKHFARFFQTYQSRRVIKNTLVLSAYSILAGFPVPIIFALIMNCVRNERVKKTVQSVICLPHFISTVVMLASCSRYLIPVPGCMEFLRKP